MKSRVPGLKNILFIVLGLAVIGVTAIVLKHNKDKAQQHVYQFSDEKAVTVVTDTLKYKNIRSASGYPGTFEPFRETKVSADMQGKVNEIFADIGSEVQQGDALVQLDNSVLRLQLDAVQVQIDGLTTDVKRYTVLAEHDAIQNVQLEKAEQGLKSAQVQKAILEEQIRKTTIRAPFTGIVTSKLTEVGAFAAPGVPLLQITEIGKLRFTLLVPENELKQFEASKPYSLTADSYPDIVLNAKLIMVGSKANPGNSFPVQFIVSNTDDLKIKAGMFGKLFLDNTDEKSISIPAAAITGTVNQPQVYVVRSGKAALQNIIVSKRIKDLAIISSGLNEGDIIITQGLINLSDGVNVVAH